MKSSPPLYPPLVVRPIALQVRQQLVIIPTHMFRIPPITPCKPRWECGLLALESSIAAAHDALSQVIEAMADVPRTRFWQLVELVRGIRRHYPDDRVKAVELVRDGRGEG